MPCLNISVTRKLNNLIVTTTRVCSVSSMPETNYYPLLCIDGYLIIGVEEEKSYLYVKKKDE